MARLTDTQLVILSSASRRDDRGVDLPTNVTVEAVRKAVDKLIHTGLLEEVHAAGSLPIWRRDDETGPMALRITKQGLEAIDVEDEATAAPNETSLCPAPAREVEAPAAEVIASRKRSSVAARKQARKKQAPGKADGEALDNEIARLRGLDLEELRARWHTAFRRRAPPHLPRHLLFRVLAYRLQADRLGELDADTRRLLDRIGSGSSDETDRLAADLNRTRTELKPGTLLTREWDGHLQRVMVLPDGFSWNSKTYPSLSKLAFAMTGTRWNGPRFFGLRDHPASEVRS